MAAICVFCGSSTTVDRSYLELAAAVGTELGRRGHTLVSGGGRVGMMGAVGEAARTAGAPTVGVIPNVLYTREVADTASDELTVTADMAERKNLMLAKADAFVTLPGGTGTLDELFEAWTTASLGLHNKPMVLLDPADFYAGLRAWLAVAVEHRFVRPDAGELVRVARTAAEALDIVEAALGSG